MFSRKKKTASPRKKDRTNSSLPFEFGVTGFKSNQEENDSDLEAELFALTGERSTSDFTLEDCDGDDDLEAELNRIIGAEKNSIKTNLKKEQNVVNPKIDLAASDDESDDVDENDPELLSELKILTTVSSEEEDDHFENIDDVPEAKETVSQLELITKRLLMYRDAESAAKAKKDLARARRYSRGIKTLEQVQKKAQSGVFVPYDEIPPEIATNLKPDAPIVTPKPGTFKDPTRIVNDIKEPVIDPEEEKFPYEDKVQQEAIAEDDQKLGISNITTKINTDFTEPEQAATEENHPKRPVIENHDPLLILITSRREEFRKQALAAKKSGDIQLALTHMREVKTCEKLITMHNSGNVISESDIPHLPAERKLPIKVNAPIQNSASAGAPFLSGEVFTAPKTVQEALNQRLNYYMKAMRKAESMGQRNDLRKIENIVKIYQNAIKLNSKGSSVPFQKLPTPPGCPPIPLTFQMA